MFFRSIFKTIFRLYYSKFKTFTHRWQFIFYDLKFQRFMFNEWKTFRITLFVEILQESVLHIRMLFGRVFFWVRYRHSFNPIQIGLKKIIIGIIAILLEIGSFNSFRNNKYRLFEYSYYFYLVYLYSFDRRNFFSKAIFISICIFILFLIFVCVPLWCVNSSILFSFYFKNNFLMWFWIFEVILYGDLILILSLVSFIFLIFFRLRSGIKKNLFAGLQFSKIFKLYEAKNFGLIDYVRGYYHPFNSPMGMSTYSLKYRDWIVFPLFKIKWPFKLNAYMQDQNRFAFAFCCQTERQFVYRFMRANNVAALTPFAAYLALIYYKKRLRNLTLEYLEYDTKQYLQYLKYQKYYNFMFRVSTNDYAILPSNFILFEKYMPQELSRINYFKSRTHSAWKTKKTWIIRWYDSNRFSSGYNYVIYQYKFYRKDFTYDYSYWYGITNHVSDHTKFMHLSNSAQRLLLDRYKKRHIDHFDERFIYEIYYKSSFYRGEQGRYF
jgi:hypothetical protein